MNEYMFYIRNEKDAKLSLTATEHGTFIRQCEIYISNLQQQNKLLAAQPLVREGIILKKNGDGWHEEDITANNTTQVGYYHIYATDFAEAVQIAKENPEFEFVPSASIEIRPVKTKEPETGFMYPTK